MSEALHPTDLATNHTSKTHSLMPWGIWGIGAFFYCYVYFLRVTPSVMMDDLVNHFHISAAQFGNLSAFFYYAYSPMQLPVGVIIDRLGAKVVLFTACLFCVLGLAIFVSANSLAAACFGRFMIGFGASFSYITSLKLATIWLPTNRFAMAAGLTTAFGMASAIFSDQYLTHIIANVGYKNALYSSLVAGLILAVMIFMGVRNRPKKEEKQNQGKEERATFKELLRGLAYIFKNKQMWIIGIIGCLLYMPASVFLDIWGIPYLKTVYNLTPQQAANAVMMIFLGWIIASPLFGLLSDHIQQRRKPLLLATGGAAILLSIIFYAHSIISFHLLCGLFFLFGICVGSHPLCFSLSRENVAKKFVATATSATNFLIMMGGVIFQPVVGWLLDIHRSSGGGSAYTPADFTFALSVLPIGLILCVGLIFCVKETHCRFKNDDELSI